MGEPVQFTKWGILSGIFWVPGGWAGIYAIRTAGLAVAVGTWSSMIVLTSFSWGIFVFEEHVNSKLGACCACGTLMLGLVGMSTFSRPSSRKIVVEQVGSDDEGDKKKRGSKIIWDEEDLEGVRKRISSSQELKTTMKEKTSSKETSTVISKRGVAKKVQKKEKDKVEIDSARSSPPSSLPLTPLEMESLIEKKEKKELIHPPTPDLGRKSRRVSLFEGQLALTKRQMGICAALFNGLWGGTNLIPLHFAAHDGYGGPSYVVSFACGSLLVTIAIWILRFLYELYRLDGAITKAYHALPSFHIRQMWRQGCLSGILYSGGNFMGILAVTFLGQGVGYSFTQAQMLVSGLW